MDVSEEELEQFRHELRNNPFHIVERQSARFSAIMTNPTDQLGTVLRSHAAVELFLNHYINAKTALKNLDKIKLRHSQMIELIDEDDGRLFLYKPAMKQLNKLRNDFAHTPNFEVDEDNLERVAEIVRVYDSDPFRKLATNIDNGAPNGASHEENVEFRENRFRNMGIDFAQLEAGDPMERIKWLAYTVHQACLWTRHEETIEYLKRWENTEFGRFEED